MSNFQSGERIHLVDKKGRQYALTLKAGDLYQLSGHKIAHDDLIGKPDGSLATLSGNKTMLALRPTFGDYVLKMPRGAQVLYPKDLALIPMWADVYPGARVFEAGTGSGALTMAILRAVGPRGLVVTYEAREDFARTAMTNIERYRVRSRILSYSVGTRMRGSVCSTMVCLSIVLSLTFLSLGRWYHMPHRSSVPAACI